MLTPQTSDPPTPHLQEEECLARAIAGVIEQTRARGRSWDDLADRLLQDDAILDQEQRRWLRDVVAEAWQHWPEASS